MQFLPNKANAKLIDPRAILRSRGAAIVIIVSITTINPFTASATPPDGFVFVAGDITLHIPVKSGSFGVAQNVTVQITAGGDITESVAGTVEAAIAAAGYTEGDTVPMTASGVETEVYVPPAGLVVHSQSFDRQGTGLNTNTITHPNMAITQSAAQLIALEVYRSAGSVNGSNFTIDGVTSTNLATNLTFQTSGRAYLRGITNTSVDALATVSFIGVTTSTSTAGICALFSVDGANTYILDHIEATTGATSLSTTASVLDGDLLVLIPFANSLFVGGVYTGATEVSAIALNGVAASCSGVAVQAITADNAAYPVAYNWASGGNSPAFIICIIRKV